MTLDQALNILADFHTRDDDQVGFVVHMSAGHHYAPWRSDADYVTAWRTVRAHLRRSIEPHQETPE